MIAGFVSFAADTATEAEIPAEVKAQIEKLHSSDKAERADAVMSLRYLGMSGKADAAIPYLLEMLENDNSFPAIKLMISSLSSITESCTKNYTFGGEAAETLARIGKPSDTLLTLLSSSNQHTKANAIRALGGLRDSRAIDPLLAILKTKDAYPEVKGNAALALGMLNSKRAVTPLIAALNDQNAVVRKSYAAALGKLKDSRAVTPLIAISKDTDPQVRIAVIASLAQIEKPSCENTVLEALADENRQVREITARALGRFKNQQSVDALITALNDAYANVQINAAKSLGEIKNPQALIPLISLLTNHNNAVRSAAAIGLGNLGDERAQKPLIAMLLKENRWEIPLVRGLNALTKLGHPGAAEAYRKYGRHEPDWKTWWKSNKVELLAHDNQ